MGENEHLVTDEGISFEKHFHGLRCGAQVITVPISTLFKAFKIFVIRGNVYHR